MLGQMLSSTRWPSMCQLSSLLPPNTSRLQIPPRTSAIHASFSHGYKQASLFCRFFRGKTTLPVDPAVLSQDVASAVTLPPSPGAVQYILHTSVGRGPEVLGEVCTCLGPLMSCQSRAVVLRRMPRCSTHKETRASDWLESRGMFFEEKVCAQRVSLHPPLQAPYICI
jgi:hypothetical protein